MKNYKPSFSPAKTAKYFIVPLLTMVLFACSSGSTTPSSSTTNAPHSITITLNDGTTVTIPSSVIYSPMNQQYTTIPITVTGGSGSKGEQLTLSILGTSGTKNFISSSSTQLTPRVALDQPSVIVQPDETAIVSLSVNSDNALTGNYTTTLNINYESGDTLQDLLIKNTPKCSYSESVVLYPTPIMLITSTAGTPIKVGATSTYATSMLETSESEFLTLPSSVKCYQDCDEYAYCDTLSFATLTPAVASFESYTTNGLLTAKSVGATAVSGITFYLKNQYVSREILSLTYLRVES